MYTVEAAVVFSLIFLSYAYIVSGAVKIESIINNNTVSVLEEERDGHTEGNEKNFKPEEIIRGMTILE